MRTHQSHRRAIRAHAGKRIEIDMILRQIQAPATNASHNMPDHTDACTSLQRVAVLEIHITSDDQNLYQEQIPNWSASTPGLPAEDTDCPPHPMSRFRWWIVLNKKTYLIIAHSRDARDKEIKSCALDHELDELNTGNALADRSSFGLQLCNSIQANDMEERCSFGIHIYNISRNTISFIYDSCTLHISKLSRNMNSFIWIWLHSLWSISDHQNA